MGPPPLVIERTRHSVISDSCADRPASNRPVHSSTIPPCLGAVATTSCVFRRRRNGSTMPDRTWLAPASSPDHIGAPYGSSARPTLLPLVIHDANRDRDRRGQTPPSQITPMPCAESNRRRSAGISRSMAFILSEIPACPPQSISLRFTHSCRVAALHPALDDPSHVPEPSAPHGPCPRGKTDSPSLSAMFHLLKCLSHRPNVGTLANTLFAGFSPLDGYKSEASCQPPQHSTT